MFRTRDPQLLRRAAAARVVLPKLDLEDRVYLLSLVVWPPERVLAAEQAAAADDAALSQLMSEFVAVL
jgi:hypothetical protein